MVRKFRVIRDVRYNAYEVSADYKQISHGGLVWDLGKEKAKVASHVAISSQ